jgi:hypothetical protein
MGLGLLAGITAHNLAVGIVVAVGGSVAGWYGIRAMERLLGRGVNAGFAAISNRIKAAKNAPPATGYPQQPQGYGTPPSPPPGYPPPAAPPAHAPAPITNGAANYPPAQSYGYSRYPQPPAAGPATPRSY